MHHDAQLENMAVVLPGLPDLVQLARSGAVGLATSALTRALRACDSVDPDLLCDAELACGDDAEIAKLLGERCPSATRFLATFDAPAGPLAMFFDREMFLGRFSAIVGVERLIYAAEESATWIACETSVFRSTRFFVASPRSYYGPLPGIPCDSLVPTRRQSD